MRFQSRTHSLLRPSQRRSILPLTFIVAIFMITIVLGSPSTADAAQKFRAGEQNAPEQNLLGGTITQGDPDTGQNKVPDTTSAIGTRVPEQTSSDLHQSQPSLDQWLVINLAILESYLFSMILNR